MAVWGGPTWGLDLETIHLTRLDRRAGRAEAGVRQHRGVMLEGDVRTVRGTPVSSPARAVLETATFMRVEPALVQVNDMLHRRLVTPAELGERFAQMEGWPGSSTTDLVLRLSDSRIESVAESRFFYLCWRQGLPAPELQYEVYDARGNLVALLDFAWPLLGVFAEVDGKAKYLERRRKGETVEQAVLREKSRENLVRRLTGWRGLRVDWADLERPEATGRMVARELFPVDLSA